VSKRDSLPMALRFVDGPVGTDAPPGVRRRVGQPVNEDNPRALITAGLTP